MCAPPLLLLLLPPPTMSLWVDKYRPVALDKLDYHKEQAAQLTRLATSGDLPHLLFYGPSGAGKKTRIMALLRAIFGGGVEKVRGPAPPAGTAREGQRAPEGSAVAQPPLSPTPLPAPLPAPLCPPPPSPFPGQAGAPRLCHSHWARH